MDLDAMFATSLRESFRFLEISWELSWALKS